MRKLSTYTHILTRYTKTLRIARELALVEWWVTFSRLYKSSKEELEWTRSSPAIRAPYMLCQYVQVRLLDTTPPKTQDLEHR